MDSSIRTVRQLGQVFEPHRVMFEELEGRREAAAITVLLHRKENTKTILKQCFLGRSIIRGFSLFATGLGT
jgi:hypothetical protein